MPNQPNPVAIGIGAACWLLSLLAYFLGYRRSARRYDAIVEVPTVAAKDIPGLGADMVEVKGVAQAGTPLVSDLARVPCVIFQSSVTEHWTTTRTEHDSKGNTRTVTEHHSETRYANEGQIDFHIRDGSGDATVHPDGAEKDLLDSMADLDGPLPESPAYGISPHHFGGRLSYSEAVMPVGQQVYVLGQVSDDNVIQRPEVVDRPFIISYRTEDALRNRAAWGKRVWGPLASLLFIVGVVLLGAGLGIVDDLLR
jgi:hypothetical protein